MSSPKKRPSRSKAIYDKVLKLGLIYDKLSGYEKNFVKRIIQNADPNNIENELSDDQLKYITILWKEYKEEFQKIARTIF